MCLHMTQKNARKNMNLSKSVFEKLCVIRKRSQKSFGVRMSWDLFFLDLCQTLDAERKK